MTAEQTAHLHRTALSGASLSFQGTDSTLAAAIEHLCWLQTSASESSFSKPEPPGPLWRTIRSTGWPSARAKGVVDGPCGAHIVPPQADLSLLRAIESDLRSRIASTGFSDNSAKAFTGAVTEIINNIWEHSQTDRPALVVYSLESERVHIGIADLGVGILQSLRTNSRYHALASSMAALKKAMEIGVSRLEGRSRGYGFATILKAVADQWGGIRLRTGEAILTIHGLESLRQEVASYGVPLPGLQIAFSCGVEPPLTPLSL